MAELRERFPDKDIEVDGGVSPKTIDVCANAGKHFLSECSCFELLFDYHTNKNSLRLSNFRLQCHRSRYSHLWRRERGTGHCHTQVRSQHCSSQVCRKRGDRYERKIHRLTRCVILNRPFSDVAYEYTTSPDLLIITPPNKFESRNHRVKMLSVKDNELHKANR